jgi:MYXO-CTERM domain-containing protein
VRRFIGLTVLATAVAAVWAAGAPRALAQAELTGTYIRYLRIDPSGILVDVAARRSMQYSEDGGTTLSCDLFGPGAAVAGMTVEGTRGGTTTRLSNDDLTTQISTVSGPTVSGRTIRWTGNASTLGVRIDQVVAYETDDRVATLTVTLTNTGTGSLTDLYYLVTGEPDHGTCNIGTSGSTNNDVVLQPPGDAAALATATAGSTTSYTFGFGSPDLRARAHNGGFGNRNASESWNSPVDSNGSLFSTQDISLVLREPTLAAGASTTFEIYMVWGTSVAQVQERFEGAQGANLLFVSDAQTDTNIPTVLADDGHQVDAVLDDHVAGDNPALRGDLSGYDGVIWSATGSTHTNAAVFTALSDYVRTGGLVLVTGFDAIANPADAQMIAFLGGSGAVSTTASPGAVLAEVGLLMVGRVDIRGVTPTGGSADRDALTGLGAGATQIVGSTAGAQWTIREIGLGFVAFVSNGDGGPTSAHASWANDIAGGAGAFNGAVRNFAEAAMRGVPGAGLLGQSCMADTDCRSDHCVDGVCCDTACGGGATDDCQACSNAAGGMFNGLCGPLGTSFAAMTVCRAAVGPCDFPETCVAGLTGCPGDGLRSAGSVCRPAVSACDAAETCDGSIAACPTDLVSAAGTVCRAMTGACDVEEQCDGVAAVCPANVVAAAGLECRASGGVCDVAEVCDGARGQCPVDRFAGDEVECRASGGACDSAERCAGTGAACPADVDAADGTSCDDGLMCTGLEMCVAGSCVASGSPCDDGNTCTADACDEAGGCTSVPIDGCCNDSSDCNDGDPCTRDLCTRDNVCVADPLPACGGDAGAGADGGGVERDGGAVVDAGRRVDPPVDDGCGCAAPGGAPPWSTVWLLLGVLAFVRRRRR